MRILRRGFWVGLFVCVLTIVVGVVFTGKGTPQIYTATAVIEITTTAPVNFDALQSPAMLMTMVENSTLRQILGDQTPDKQILSPEDTLAFLKKNMVIVRRPGTDIFEIKVTSESPEAAVNVANEVAYFFKSTGDTEESMLEHQGEKKDLQAKADQEQAGINDELAERDKLKQALIFKGIPVPSDDEALKQLASGLGRDEDPQLHEYKVNEKKILVRQTILQTLEIQIGGMDREAPSKKGPIQIIANAEAPGLSSRLNLFRSVALSIVAGVILGVIAGTLSSLVRK